VSGYGRRPPPAGATFIDAVQHPPGWSVRWPPATELLGWVAVRCTPIPLTESAPSAMGHSQIGELLSRIM